MAKTVFVVFCVMTFTACLDQPACVRNSDNALVIQFKRLQDGKNDTLILYRVEATGLDSIFYGQSPDVPDTLNGTAMTLFVNPFEGSTSFTFYLPLLERTLAVDYNRLARFISDECGSEVSLSGLTVKYTDFDSVRVVNPILSEARTVNIEIYR